MKNVSTKLYIATFLTTICVFIASLFVSEYINKKKTDELKAYGDRIAVDILSLETQFDLLKDASCQKFETLNLYQELNKLYSRLTFMEDQVGNTNEDVYKLKRYYSILQIKDYLLAKKLAVECKRNDILILYFYAQHNCPECERQEYMLRAIQDEYPQVRVYPFDYELDLSAVKTLITLKDIPQTAPVIDIQGKAYAAFPTYEDMKVIVDSIANATTTKPKTTR
jgi:peroxiredoxin